MDTTISDGAPVPDTVGHQPSAVSVRGVHRHFRSRNLGPFDLEVVKGELVVLNGANGSGKSTLLRLLLGLDKPTRGSCLIAGAAVGPLKPPRGVGYVPDRAIFWDWRSGTENLRPFADAVPVRDLIERVGLDSADNTPLAKYSKGMRQRLSIARAIAQDPALLVMDEPTVALDADGIAMLGDLIVARNQADQTTIVATHDLEIMARLPAARVVRVVNGTTRT